MSAQFAKNDMSFTLPTAVSKTAPARREPTGFARRIAAVMQWLAEMPRRHAVMSELSALSDHELADIGLTRAELPHVFDTGFAAQRALPRASR